MLYNIIKQEMTKEAGVAIDLNRNRKWRRSSDLRLAVELDNFICGYSSSSQVKEQVNSDAAIKHNSNKTNSSK